MRSLIVPEVEGLYSFVAKILASNRHAAWDVSLAIVYRTSNCAFGTVKVVSGARRVGHP